MPEKDPRTLILASTSPFRKQLLEKLNLPFETAKPEVDETPLEGESPNKLVARLALAKAQAVANRREEAIVIGSDQVAVFNNEILGKPHTHEKAVAQLQKFSGQTVTFFTSLTVIDTRSGDIETNVVPFEVDFKSLTLEEINHYLYAEQPYNCAGSFKSEALGICLFKKLRGDDPNALIGLPLIQLVDSLNKFGFSVLENQSS